MGKRLDAKLSPVTYVDVGRAFEASWAKYLKKQPSRESLAVLLAQSALETGHWKTSYCFNLGNQKASTTWSRDFCFYPADEIVSTGQAAQAYALRAPRTDGVAGHDVELTTLKSGQVQVTLYPDHPWCRFRAFTTLQDGADDYFTLLVGRFKAAWPAVEAGDPEQFVRKLREAGYFTASVERYLPPVLSLFKKYVKALAQPAAAPAAHEPALILPVSAQGRPTLKRGASGDAVREVQRILIANGYEGVTENGSFDEAMVRVVELFQLQHVNEKGIALEADGEIGKNTWWALLNPSGEPQRTFLNPPAVEGLTPLRTKLLGTLNEEHARPVFEDPDGSNSSKDIDRYFGATGLRRLPWCCTFVSWALKEALGKLPIGGKHHTGVQMMWVAARDLGLEVKTPKPGDVFIQIKSGGTGHTGFVVGLSEDGRTVYTCEGNCGNRLKYGQRAIDTIHHFIDVIQDGQGTDFARGTNVTFDFVGADGTR
jgi:hypothetical protein